MALLEKDLGLSLSVNPERSCAREIVRSIHFSKSVRISTFAKGRVEIAEILVKEGNDLIDKAVSQIGSRFQGQVLICSVVRNNEIFIPNGNFVIHKGDRISVIATTRNLEMFLVRTGISEYRNFHEMMIIGGGRITYYLAAMLLPMGIHLKIIEKDANLPHVVFHSLRHTSTTYKLKLNHGDIKAAQGDTDHAQADMVMDLYSHILDEDRKVNAQKFEDGFYRQHMENYEEPKLTSKKLDVDAVLEKIKQDPELLSQLIDILNKD